MCPWPRGPRRITWVMLGALMPLALAACNTTLDIAVRHRVAPFPVMDTLAVLPLALDETLGRERLHYETSLSAAIASARLGLVTFPVSEVRSRFAKAGLTPDAVPVVDWPRTDVSPTRALDTTATRRLADAVGARYLLSAIMTVHTVDTTSDHSSDDDIAWVLAEVWDVRDPGVVWQAVGRVKVPPTGTDQWTDGGGQMAAADAAIREVARLLAPVPTKRGDGSDP